MTIRRKDDRAAETLRPLAIAPHAVPNAEGSALITVGDTHVLCAATVEERVPRWLAGKGGGWVTAEYSMLPRATKERTPREAALGKQGGRTVEIQRLIGRSLRAAVDLKALGERQIIVDCDVIRADGGTRCASISGAYVALALALHRLRRDRAIKKDPLASAVAAVSVGMLNGVPILDLDYAEDSKADVDVNVVMTDAHRFVEVQGTAEGAPFSDAELSEMLLLAQLGLDQIFRVQREAISVGIG